MFCFPLANVAKALYNYTSFLKKKVPNNPPHALGWKAKKKSDWVHLCSTLDYMPSV